MEVLCPVCERSMRYFGTADYYLPDIPRMDTPLFTCAGCGALYRNIDECEICRHCDETSYVKPAMEERFREQRTNFFKALITLATRTAGHAPRKCLDFGCSYGHLLLLLRDLGCRVCGVEVARQARDVCQTHHLQVSCNFDALDGSEQFDLITLIDSLYYLPRPKPVLSKLRTQLADGGLLLIRVANRNWILRMLKIAAHREHFDNWLGDAIVGYSKPALELLLHNTGYRILSTHYIERGKRHPDWPRRLSYLLGTSITYGSFGTVIMSPGIIVLATKQ